MKTRVLKTAALTLLPVVALALTGCQTTPKPTTGPAATRPKPVAPPQLEGIILDTVTAAVTIESIDAAKREVVLRRADGSLATFRCGPEVLNFDQLAVGDQVKVTAAEEYAIFLSNDGALPSSTQATVIVRTPTGTKPGGKVIDTVAFTAKVIAVNIAKRTVTIQTADGRKRTVRVGRNVNLRGVALNDIVGVRLTQAFAVVVESAGSAAAAAMTPPSPEEVAAIATEAYIFGYPLVTMEMTRRLMTNVERLKGTRAPMGHLIRMRELLTPSARDVTAPNVDTLYTMVWLDVSKEPWVLSLPDAYDRYYLFPMLDGWTDVFQSPGKRTTGTGPQTYAITGPNWTGTLPDGLKEYKSPTSLVWILGRIYCSGKPEDYVAAHQMQDEISVVPLSEVGKPYTPPPGVVDPIIDMDTPVRDQVNGLSAGDFFNLLASLMKDNPPGSVDAPVVTRMARLGILPGQTFDINKFDPAMRQVLQGVPKAALEKIMGAYKNAGTIENGWMFSLRTGTYGAEYLQRALIAVIGLGANRPQDALYPISEADPLGQPYIGTNKYVMHFDAGQLPPAQAFWSLTMYDADYFLVDNVLGRYTLSSRNEFIANPDGSIDLYLQNANPGADKEANWLPAPEGRFILMLRLYWPKETPPSILNGTWKIPPVKHVQ